VGQEGGAAAGDADCYGGLVISSRQLAQGFYDTLVGCELRCSKTGSCWWEGGAAAGGSDRV
jgi:hypothetical protein